MPTAEEWWLVTLAEEMAETSKAIMKSIRFGHSSTHPNHPEVPNSLEISIEAFDVRAIQDECISRGILLDAKALRNIPRTQNLARTWSYSNKLEYVNRIFEAAVLNGRITDVKPDSIRSKRVRETTIRAGELTQKLGVSRKRRK